MTLQHSSYLFSSAVAAASAAWEFQAEQWLLHAEDRGERDRQPTIPPDSEVVP